MAGLTLAGLSGLGPAPHAAEWPTATDLRAALESAHAIRVDGLPLRAPVLREFYGEVEFEPIWGSDPGGMARATLALQALAGARDHGLAPAHSESAPRTLAFRNLHTEETVNVAYQIDGRLDPDGLRQIEWVLRDFRTGEARPIEPRLLDLLWQLRKALDTGEPYEVISGYRLPATNAMLRRSGRGVARDSLHTRAMAIDVRIPGQSLTKLRDTALALRQGGVGYYPASGFVHVDVGRVRFW